MGSSKRRALSVLATFGAALLLWFALFPHLEVSAPAATPAKSTEALRAPLHVFLRDGIHSYAFEFNFWLTRLQSLGRPIILHPPEDQNFVEDSIIMAFDAASFVDQIKSLHRVGLFHYGDERGFSKTPALYKNFSFVIRCYYLPIQWKGFQQTNPRLAWIPNGPRADSGFPMNGISLESHR